MGYWNALMKLFEIDNNVTKIIQAFLGWEENYFSIFVTTFLRVKKEQVLFKNMKQNNIRGVLEKHQVVPVVTINNEAEVDGIITGLMSKGIFCIEANLQY